MRRIVLASLSPRRKELLSLLGVPFEVLASNAEEDPENPPESPEQYVRSIARKKATETAKKVDDALVIGADTVVVVNGLILGKPKDPEDAVRMLKLLSGKVHKVFTGVAVLDVRGGTVVDSCEECVETQVRVRELSEDMIDAYVRTGEPLDKAGAYAIQGYGSVLIEGIVGDYFNVVGLPVQRLSVMLERFGIKPLSGFAEGRSG